MYELYTVTGAGKKLPLKLREVLPVVSAFEKILS